MISPRYIIGISGHRSLPDPSIITGSIRQALAQFADATLKVNGTIELCSSIAYGADTVAVETARDMGIPVHIILPKPVETHDETAQLALDEGFAADFWKDGQFLQNEWDRAYKQIQDARTGTNSGTLRLVRGAQTSPECYYDTGVQMLDCCDAVIAVWNGKPAAGLGGTADVVDLARIRGLPLMIIDPATGAVSSERMDKFAHHQEPGITVLRELSQHVKKHHPAFAAAKGAKPTFPMSISDAETYLGETAETLATHFRSSMLKIIRGHGLATGVAAITAVFSEDGSATRWILATLTLVECLFVFHATFKQRRLRSGRSHNAWLQSRFAAEIIRGLKDSENLLDPLAPLIVKHHPVWRRFAIAASLSLYHPNQRLHWSEEQKRYVESRLAGQIKYFTDKQRDAARIFYRASWWSSTLGTAAATFVFGALVFKVVKVAYPIQLDGWAKYGLILAFTLLPILLPLSVSLGLSLRNALDASRRTFRYNEMAARLRDAKALIESLKTASSTRRAIAATEEILIDELNEWHLAEKQNGGH